MSLRLNGTAASTSSGSSSLAKVVPPAASASPRRFTASRWIEQPVSRTVSPSAAGPKDANLQVHEHAGLPYSLRGCRLHTGPPGSPEGSLTKADIWLCSASCAALRATLQPSSPQKTRGPELSPRASRCGMAKPVSCRRPTSRWLRERWRCRLVAGLDAEREMLDEVPARPHAEVRVVA